MLCGITSEFWKEVVSSFHAIEAVIIRLRIFKYKEDFWIVQIWDQDKYVFI